MIDNAIAFRDRLLTPAQAAEMLGLSPKALDHRRQSGEFKFVRVGKLVRYRESTLLDFISNHEGLMASRPRGRRRKDAR